jgi:hypothetical protein
MNHPEEFTKTTPNHIVKWVLKERQQVPKDIIHTMDGSQKVWIPKT